MSAARRRRRRRRAQDLRPIGLAAVVGLLVLALLGALQGFARSVEPVLAAMRADPSLARFRPEPVRVYDRDGALLGYVVGTVRQDPVPLSKIPFALRNATVAVEDKRFYLHHGVDLYRLVAAFVHDVGTGHGTEGASTITMQVVKNIYEPTVKTTLLQKAEEIYLATALEQRATKAQILGAYLNDVYYGNDTLGVQAASLAYFGQPIWRVDLSQAALLAGLPQAPSVYNPVVNPAAARRRRNLVLRLMADQGYISAAQATAAERRGLELRRSAGARAARRGQARSRRPQPPDEYLLNNLQRELVDRYGAIRVERGGFGVYTTIDPVLERAAGQALRNALPRGSRLRAMIAMIDARSGHVLVLASNDPGGASWPAPASAFPDPAGTRPVGAVASIGALALASAYAAVADGGGAVTASIIRTIRGGGTDSTPAPLRGPTVDQATAFQATRRLRAIAAKDLAARVGVPVAVTGARSNGLAASYAGYTPGYATAVLVQGNGQRDAAERRAVARGIWHEFMLRAVAHGCYESFSGERGPQSPVGVLPCRPASLASVLQAWTDRHPDTSALVVRLGRTGIQPSVWLQPDIPRMPASTMKAITAAGALIILGSNFRFHTWLFAGPRARREGSTLRGALYLKGFGDPILSTAPYARRFLGGYGGEFATLARMLAAQGIRRVRGPIVADESFFDERRIGPDWLPSYRLEAGPLSALAVNEGFRGDGHRWYARNPPRAAALRFERALSAAGVRHDGPLEIGTTPRGRKPLVAVSSPALRTIVRLMNVPSDIFIAEMLAKDVAAYSTGRGTTSAGVARIAAVLRARRILGAADHLVDGSGLSRDDHVTVRGLVRLLVAAERNTDWGSALLASLPQSHQGTLWRRFLSEPAAGLVQAKTGHLRDASVLIGVVRSKAGERYVFAFAMNHYRRSERDAADDVQDRLVEMLAAGAADSPPAARGAAPESH